MIFSPTDVVSKLGPAGCPFSLPNFAQARRSATSGLTVSRTMVVRIRRVVFTFLPGGFMLLFIFFLGPSGCVFICGAGRAVGSSGMEGQL